MIIVCTGNWLDRLSVRIENKIEELEKRYWSKRYRVFECYICGQLLVPYIEHTAPSACGWVKVRKKLYICHQCMEHSYFENGAEYEEHRKMIEENNKFLRKKMKQIQDERGAENVKWKK